MNTHDRIVRQEVHGATVVTISDPSLPVVRFLMGLRVGALADPEGQAGATRLWLELMLRGTKSRSRQAFTSDIEYLGSSVSASTGDETALIRGLCLTRNLDATMALVEEAMTSPAFDSDEHRVLVEECVEEMGSLSDNDGALGSIFWRRSLYGDGLMGRLPAGEIDELVTIEPDHLRAMHGSRLSPESQVWVFVGDITPADAASRVEKIVSQCTPTEVPALPEAMPAEQQGMRIVVVDKPERTQSQLRVGQPTMSGYDDDAEAFWLGSTAFGGTFTSTFTREIREVRGWSYYAFSEFRRRSRFTVPFVLHTAPAQDDAVACLGVQLDLYRELAEGALAVDEVTRARSYIQNRYPLSIATASDLVVPAFELELLGRDLNGVFGLPERLDALDCSKIPSLLGRHLNPDNALVVMVATADAVIDDLQKRWPAAAIDRVDYRHGLERDVTSC